jgi:hypothetical protein
MAKIDKTALLNAPKEERVLFFGLAHMANEIKAYEKLYLWSSQTFDEGEGWAEGKLTMSLMLTKALAGKLYEGYQMFERDYLNTNLFSTYNPSLPEEIKNAIEKLKIYFQSDNLIELTRNQFAFHYSPKKMDRVLKNLPEDLKIYIETNGNANNLYYFAELLANYALLFEIDSNDWQAAFRKLRENLSEIVQLFSAICDGLMMKFMGLRIEDFWQDYATEVKLEGMRSFTEIQLPWFTDTVTLFKDAG